MSKASLPLSQVYDGWDGYNRSLRLAIEGLSAEQLAFRASAEMRSVGELALHIADGRVDWFRRMQAPKSDELWREIQARPDVIRWTSEALSEWLEATWEMVGATLKGWTVDELAVTYEHTYHKTVFAVSRQWTIWRILTHDVHHGGQLSELLAMQGIFPAELTALGGHLTEPAILRVEST